MTATWEIREGDALERLCELPDGSAQCCVTSPPYFGLRDYGAAGQIGLESTPDEYVERLVAAFREVRRVLRDDGTLWLNLGDSYAANRTYQVHNTKGASEHTYSEGSAVPPGCKPKDLLGVPWMVAFALRADGWYLRSEIIWHKPNPMPESVTDRPTRAHEQVFLLSKSPRYFYDAAAISEPSSTDGPMRWGSNEKYEGASMKGRALASATRQPGDSRNRRTVWTVATQPFAGAHFATFPPRLIEPMVLAGSSDKVCSGCGAPWRRVVARTPMVVRPTPKRADWQAGDDHARTQIGGTMLAPATSHTMGFEPSCSCDAATIPGTVLDPFCGAGTTGMVALRNDRSFIGLELNAEYAELARNRIRDDAPLLNVPAEAPAA